MGRWNAHFSCWLLRLGMAQLLQVASLLRRLLLALMVVLVQPSFAWYVAKLCRGHMCNDPTFPILDWSPESEQCHCLAHPCWNDNGVAHSCADGTFLTFHFDADRKLQCQCTDRNDQPLSVSKWISHDKCPGLTCPVATPILDWSPENPQCICRTHPCANAQCNDPKFPLLRFREEHAENGEASHVCECVVLPQQATKLDL